MFVLGRAPGAGAAPSFRAKTTTNGGSGATITHGTMPAHSTGETLIWVVAASGVSTPTLSTPSGWTLIGAVQNASSATILAVFGKIAASGAESAPTSSITASAPTSYATMLSYSGTNPSSSLDGTPTTQALSPGATSYAHIGMTTTVANVIVIRASFAYMSSGVGTGHNWASSTERDENSFVNWSSVAIQMAVADKTQAAIGATGTETISTSTAFNYTCAVTFALKA